MQTKHEDSRRTTGHPANPVSENGRPRRAWHRWLAALTLAVCGQAWAIPDVNTAFSPAVIYPGQTSQVTIRLFNPAMSAANGVAVAAALPAGVEVLAPGLVTNTCGGAVTLSPGGNALSLAGGTIPASTGSDPGSCEFAATVTSRVKGAYTHLIPVGAVTSTDQGSNVQAAEATLTTIVQDFTVAKSFLPSSTVRGFGTVQMRLQLTNPNPVPLTQVTLPDEFGKSNGSYNIRAMTSPAPTSSCGGVVTITPVTYSGRNTSTVSLAGATVPANGSCEVLVNVEPSAPHETYTSLATNNTIPISVATSAEGASNGNAVAAYIYASTGAVVSKYFSPASVNLGETSVLTISLSNYSARALSNFTLNDPLPADLNPGAIVGNTCGGTVNVSASQVQLIGASLDASTATTTASCLVQVRVAPSVARTYTNTIPAQTIDGVNTNQSTGNLNVLDLGIFRVTKGFSRTVVAQGETADAVINLENISPTQTVTAINIRDRMTTMNAAGNFIVSRLGGATTTCGGTLTAAPGATEFRLDNATLGPQSTCQIRVPILVRPGLPISGTTSFVNRLQPAQSDITFNGGTVYPYEVNASLFVHRTLTVSKSFAPAAVGPLGITRLRITVQHQSMYYENPMVDGSIVDPLPLDHQVAAVPNAITSCPGATINAVPGASTVGLSGITFPHPGPPQIVTCTLEVDVRVPALSGGLTQQSATNAIPTANINGYLPNTPAFLGERFNVPSVTSATITRQYSAVTVNKEFLPTNINGGGKSRVRISFVNTDPAAVLLDSGVLADTLPPNLQIHADAAPAVSGSGCSATGFTVVPGAQSATVSGLVIPVNGNCRFEFNVTGVVGGNHVNTLAAGDLTTRQGVTNANAASATLTINRTMNVGKGFLPTVIGAGQNSVLTLIIYNASDGTTEQGPAGGMLTDTMPAGVRVTGAGSTTCAGASVSNGVDGGGRHFVRLSGGTYPPQATCRVTIPVTADTVGSFLNEIAVGDLRTVGGTENADAASATLEVIAPPTVTKSMSPTTLVPGAQSSVTLTLFNPHAASRLPTGFTGIRLSDALTNMVLASPLTVTSNCPGLVWSGTVGGNLFEVLAANLLPMSNCNIQFPVTSTVVGTHPNQTTGVTTDQTTVPGPPSNIVNLTIPMPPTVEKAFTPTLVGPGAPSRMTIRMLNPNAAVLATLNSPEALSDLFPTSPGAMVVADPPNLAFSGCSINPTVQSWNGIAATTLAGGAPGIRVSGGRLNVSTGAVCTIALDVIAPVVGDYLNTTSTLATTSIGTSATGASATMTVQNPSIDVVKSAGLPVQVGVATWNVPYSITIGNRGTVGAARINAVDNLAATFVAGSPTLSIVPGSFAVSGAPSCAPPATAFDGQANQALLSGNVSLAPTQACTITFTVRVAYPSPAAVPVPVQNNQAHASSTGSGTNPGGLVAWNGATFVFVPPAGVVAQDSSTHGPTLPATANGDTPSPTPVTLTRQQIGVAKQVVAQSLVSPGRYAVTWRIAVANTGGTPATHVQVSDDVAAAFPPPAAVVSVGGLSLAAATGGATAASCPLNPSFGLANIRLLAGTSTLQPGEGCDLRITATVDANGAIGPFLNQAVGTTHGASPGSPGAPNPSDVLATDLSDSGPSPSGTNPGAPGDFGGPDDPTPVALSDQRIAAVKRTAAMRQTGAQRFEVDFAVGVANVGTTPATFVQMTDPLVNAFPAPAAVVAAGGLAITGTTGGATAALCAVNPSFSLASNRLMAGTQTLPVGAGCTYGFTVTVELNGATGPFFNQVIAEAYPTPPGSPGAANPATPVAVDASDSGTDPSGTNPGQPGDTGGPDDPTPVPLTPQTLGVAKQVLTMSQPTLERFVVTFRVAVQNIGALPATHVQVSDDLVTAFPAPVTLISATGLTLASTLGGATALQCDLNPGFSLANTRLMSGLRSLDANQGCVYLFTVTLEPNGAPGPFVNTAIGTTHVAAPPAPGAPNPSLVLATDLSDSGTDPTTTNPGQPGDSGGRDDPTPVTLVTQTIGVAKRVAAITPVAMGRYAVDFVIVVGNTGPSPATNIQVRDDLATAFPAPLVIVAAGPPTIAASGGGASALDCALNAGFGVANPNLMTGTRTLQPGASCTIALRVTIDVGQGVNTTLTNQAVATTYLLPPPSPGATNPLPPAATDRSDSGTSITGTNPGAPGDTGGPDDPTPVLLPSTISGSVWFDGGLDGPGDGIRGPSEPGLAGWQVELIWPPGAPNAGTVVTGLNGSPLVVHTGSDGSYRFGDVPPGQYQIRFRAPSSGGSTGAVHGTPVNGEQGPGSGSPDTLVNAPGRVLDVTIRSGAQLVQQSLPVDPSGVVYDAITRAPIAGATVTLLGASGQPLPAACLLDGQQNQVTAGSGGMAGAYRFDILPGADPACPVGATHYTIAVTAPGYTGPSALLPPSGLLVVPVGSGSVAILPGATAPAAGSATTYYLQFVIGADSRHVIHNHIPLDPADASQLAIEKRVDKPEAELGDMVRYAIRVRNNGTSPIVGVVVQDRLPAGFRYIERTARAQAGTALAEPAGAPGPRLVFAIGTVAPGETVTFFYRARVGVGAMQGDGINRARACLTATADGAGCSTEARAQVRVTGGVFSPEACIAGKVFVDCNGNHVQDREEVGIPGVRLYLQSGLSIVTDVEGKYSVCDLTANTHTIKVDPVTMPRGSRLTTSSNRNVGDANSLFVDLKNGMLQRADFVEGSCSNRVLEQVKARRAQGEVRGPETEQRGGAGLSFETKAPAYAPQGTDSANQPVPVPRGGVLPLETTARPPDAPSRSPSPPVREPMPVSRGFQHQPLSEVPVDGEGMPPSLRRAGGAR